MIATLRAALVIARRDYVATVWSRAFLFFLISPLFPILFGVLFGAIGARMEHSPGPPVVAVLASPAEQIALDAARRRMTDALGESVIPRLSMEAPGSDVGHLLARPGIAAVLDHVPTRPTLTGPEAALDRHGDAIRLLLNDMYRSQSLAAAGLQPREAALTPVPVRQPTTPPASARTNLARSAQLLLLMLTMILAGMLLSNLIEEKSNKVIEVLAAAVPVDAIFVGKLVGMLGMSLTGISVWATVATGGIALFAPEIFADLPTPAVGWPLFVALGVAYFIACYLLLGALFLGIGGQAATVREVQTLSMPVTMGQLLVFALAAASVEDMDGPIAKAACMLPWSSPFAMLARAAQWPSLWPHLAALLWQGLWIALIVRIGARMFRYSVLKTGRSPFRFIRRSSSAR